MSHRDSVLFNPPREATMDENRPILEPATKLFRSRFLMLFLFFLYSMFSAFQWIQYASISNIVTYYYGVDEIAVSWTSMVYMIAYVLLIFLGAWLLDRYELRFTVLLGSFGTCLGPLLKRGSLRPNLFPVMMFGQIIAAISNVFILGIPPHLAAVWFGNKELSRACAVGVFGNQLGVALGFAIPPSLVSDSKDKAEITRGLGMLSDIIAASTTVIFIAIFFLFKNKPPLPPSLQEALRTNMRTSSFWLSVTELMRNMNYVLLLITFGINVGVFYAVCILLNQMVLVSYPGEDEKVGSIGLIIIISGLPGSIISGIILDKTKKFKQSALAFYGLSTMGMLAFALVLRYGAFWMLFLTAGSMGFFMTGYIPLGFEFSAEVTYPEPEGISAGFLNAGAQLFGLLFTISASSLLQRFGGIVSNSFLCLTLVVGMILTAFVKSDLRRDRVAQAQSVGTTNENHSQHT